MLFYSIELLHVHITCLHVYYCLHIPSSFAQDARLCHGRGKDSRKLWRYPNSSSRLGFHGFGVAHAKGGLEVALPPKRFTKAKPLMDAKVRHEDPKKGLHDVRSCIGACNFYHPHIKSFTYTRAILTDLIKNSTTWRWGPQEQQVFDELKDKVANAKCFGVPRAQW